MHVLIIGLSSIVQRRVLPALAAIDAVTAIDVASKSKTADPAQAKLGATFTDYDRALAGSRADVIYVSLPNNDHRHWIEKGLQAGKHVIVDKPAVLSLQDASACAALAASRKLLFAEATVFSYHTQFRALADFFRQNGPLTHISAQFIIPPLPASNFRNYKDMGGGCLTDMGPYAAALARLFSDQPPEALHVEQAPPDAKLDIDMGFSFLARFPGGLRYSGHFSFESEYQNSLLLVGKKGSVSVERIFSLPADQDAVWQVRRQNKAAEERHGASDSFRNFFEAIIAALASGDFSTFTQDLLQDAAFRDRLHHS